MHGTLDAYVVSLPGLDKSTATNYGPRVQSSRSASRSTGSTASSSVHRSSRSARALTRRRMCKSMDLDEAILCAYS